MALAPWPDVATDLHLLGVTFDELSEDQALRKVRATLRGLLVGEIRRCLTGVPVGQPIGLAALMLSVAAIDILGGIYRGGEASGPAFWDLRLRDRHGLLHWWRLDRPASSRVPAPVGTEPEALLGRDPHPVRAGAGPRGGPVGPRLGATRGGACASAAARRIGTGRPRPRGADDGGARAGRRGPAPDRGPCTGGSEPRPGRAARPRRLRGAARARAGPAVRRGDRLQSGRRAAAPRAGTHSVRATSVGSCARRGLQWTWPASWGSRGIPNSDTWRTGPRLEARRSTSAPHNPEPSARRPDLPAGGC